MADQMVDRQKRLSRCQRQGLGGGQSYHHAANQAGTRRGGDGVHLIQCDAGLGQRLLDQAIQYFQMGAGSDFRHHAPIRRMGFILAEDDIGQDFARSRRRALDHSGGGFVAAGFQA